MNGEMNAAHALSARMLRWFVPRLAPDMQPWGEAMLAELEAVRGRMESLAWALGGATVMMRILMKQWLRLGAQWLGSEDPLAGGTRPPRRWTGIAMAVLALSLLFVPGFRQALRMAFGTWLGVVSPRQSNQSPYAEMPEVAARGEQQHDAVLLAFAALRSADPVRRETWAARAIAIDPTLTWVRVPLAYGNMLDSMPFYTIDGRQAPRISSPPAAPPYAELQAWDPNNAVVYLLEADWIRFEAREHQGKTVGLAANPQWRAAMDKAFAAPGYDDFADRTFNLTREALRRLGWSRPLMLATALRPYIQPVLQSYDYAKVLLDEADRLPPEARLHQYWAVLRFAGRLHTASPGGQAYGSGLEFVAYRRMVPLLRSLGRADEAAVLEYRLQELKNRGGSLRPVYSTQNSTYTWLASVVMVSSAVAALCAAMLLLGWLADALALWPRMARLRRPARWTQRWAAPVLLAACTLMYLCYRPFADAYWFFMNTPRAFEYGPLLNIFYSFSVALYRVTFAGPERAFYFWCVVLVPLTLLLVWRVRRLAHA